MAVLAKRRAKGICDLCKEPVPFNNKSGEAFLGVHHVIWLSRGGVDKFENTEALCPNCQSKMHVLDREQDKAALTSAAQRPISE